VTRAVSTPNTFDDVKIAGNVACLGSDDLKDDRGSLDAFLILPAHCSATAAVNLPGTTPVIMLRLAQNQPNPFDPAGGTTNISFTLPGATRASLQMFDVTGRRVRILVDQLLMANCARPCGPSRWLNGAGGTRSRVATIHRLFQGLPSPPP
jgi:hypothetical protein